MRNWNNTIGLLMPVKLQRSVKLRRLLQMLLSRTVDDALKAESRKEAIKAEHRHQQPYCVVPVPHLVTPS